MARTKTQQSAVLNTREAAAYLGLSKSTLEKKRGRAGNGPPFVRMDGAVRYRRIDLDAYLRERCFQCGGWNRPLR